MDTPFLILRLVHVLAGSFWIGAVLMTVLFLMRAVADAGTAGGQVMGAMVKRRYLDFLPTMALLTVLSGIDLLRRVSGGFDSAWFSTPMGMTLSIGAIAGLLALVAGVAIARPATLGGARLMAQVASLPDGEEKGRLVASAGALRARAARALQGAAVLLVVSVSCMAIARYV